MFDAVAHRENEFNPAFDEVADRLSRQMQIPLDPVEISQQGLRPRRDGVTATRAQAQPEPIKPEEIAKPLPPSAAPPADLPTRASTLGPHTQPTSSPVPALGTSPTSSVAADSPPSPRKSSVERRRKSASRTASPSQWPEPLAENKDSLQERTEARRARQAKTRNKSERSTAPADLSVQQSTLPLELASPKVEVREPERSHFTPAHQEMYAASPSLSAPTIGTWLWSALAIGALAFLLAAQVFWTQRHELATHYPALKPVLDNMCQRLQCKVLPLRQLDMVAIDNSVFRLVAPSEKGDRFQLSWVVTNQALIPVAAPALELTLNDVLDRPLLRKVILPADVTGNPALAVAPEGKWQGVLNLTVLPPEGGVKVSGYRLLAFYP